MTAPEPSEQRLIADLVRLIREERSALVMRKTRDLGYTRGYDDALVWVLTRLLIDGGDCGEGCTKHVTCLPIDDRPKISEGSSAFGEADSDRPTDRAERRRHDPSETTHIDGQEGGPDG